MSARCLHARRSRIRVELPRWSSTRQQRELTAFARYCIARLERDLGEVEEWHVTAGPDPRGGYACTVVARRAGQAVEAHGAGHDGTLSIWDALCNIEQALREELLAVAT